MFVGELGLELSGGIGTSIGGNSQVTAGKQKNHYYQMGHRGAVKKPTVPYRGLDDATVTRRKSGLNYLGSMPKCEDTIRINFNIGVSGFASIGVGRMSIGGAFDYQIGHCAVPGDCEWTWDNAPTANVINGMGTGARIQVYGRASAMGSIQAW